MKITRAQLGRLQTLCSQMAQRVAGYSNTREARLAWAAQKIGHTITSFSELTMLEAQRLIDAAQGEVGHRAPSKAPRRSAGKAHRAGVDGRRGDKTYSAAPEMASGDDLATIASYYQRLGWDKTRFEAWLASRSSPIRPRRTVATTADANRVRWALKGMLQDAGLWINWGAA